MTPVNIFTRVIPANIKQMNESTKFYDSACRRLSVTLCIVAKWCALEQKLLLRVYRKSYMRNRLVPKWMTLTSVSRSYQVHVNRCVIFDVEYLGNRKRQRFGSKGLSIRNGIWAIEWSRDRWCHVTLKGQTRDPIRLERNISKTTWASRDFNFLRSFFIGSAEQAHK